MKTTTNYGFKQPEGTDIVNIDDISDNFGSVDTEIKKANDKVVAHEGKGGTVHADVTTTTSGFMSAADKTKLNGIAAGAQTNQNAVQSIQVVTPTGTVVGTATASNTTDTIQLKEGNNIDIAVSGKVVTVNNTYSYTHPTGDGNLHVPTTGTSNSGKVLKAGSTAGSLAWGTLTPTDVGALPTSHEGQGGSVHADVTTSASGFMSAADKTKLNGIAVGAQTNQNAVQSIQAVTSAGTSIGTAAAATATDTIQLKEGSNIDIAVSGKTLTLNNTYSYTHPTSDGNLHVPATGTSNSGKVLKAGSTAGSLAWGTLTSADVGALPTSHQGQGGSVHADVTTSASGFMSAADKTKLNGIAAGAQTNQNAVQSIQAVTSSGTAIGTATAASATDTIQLKEGNNISITASGKVLTLNNTYSYTHPTGDGNLHVPATGTSNSGKVLKAGSIAGSLAWGELKAQDIKNNQGSTLEDELNNSVIRNMCKQVIINGNFDIWQRGLYFSSGGYTADRWWDTCCPNTITTRQNYDDGIGSGIIDKPTYYLRVSRTSTLSVGNGYLQQRIEDVRTLSGRFVTLSFWARGTAGKSLQFAVEQVFGSGGSSTVSVIKNNFIITNAWNKYVFTFELPSVYGKAIGTDSSVCISFLEASSFSTFVLDIAQVQLVSGNKDVGFIQKSFKEEYEDCLRYYYRMTSENNTWSKFAVGMATGGASAHFLIPFPKRMRINPTFTCGNAGLFGVTNSTLGNLAINSLSQAESTWYGCSINIGLPTGSLFAGQSTLLQAYNSTAAWLAFDAEL